MVVTLVTLVPQRPFLFQATHLVVEIFSLKSCDVEGNSLQFTKVEYAVTNKSDFALNAALNVSRNAVDFEEVGPES